MPFYTHDNTLDSPLNNFATWNPLDKARDNTVLADGNLVSIDTTSGYSTNYASIVVPNTGLYYVEFTVKTFGASNAVGIYVGNNRDWPNRYGSTGYPFDTNTFMIMHNGYLYHNQNTTNEYHPTFGVGDVIALIIDGSSRNFWVQKNGSVISGDNYTTGSQSGGVVGALSGISALPDGDMYVYTMASGSANPAYHNSIIYMNAGQDQTFGGVKQDGGGYSDANGIGQFYHQPPAGALALCTANLEEGPIKISEDDVPADYFKTVTWTGSGSSRNIEVGWQPDLVWVKNRNNSNESTWSPSLYDSLRPDGHRFSTDNTNANQNYSSHFGSITSTGFSFPNSLVFNDPNGTYVGWCLRAGGKPSSDGKAMIDGVEQDCNTIASDANSSITPVRMSVGTKQGMSLMSYVGTGNNATIPHGLNKAPELVIAKCSSQPDGWFIYNKSIGANNYLRLDQSIASSSASTLWNSTDPNESVIHLGSNGGVSGSGRFYLMYAFTSITGYSKIGSFIGNGSSSGPYVYCGFRPSFLLLKHSTGANQHWWIFDSTRDPMNPVGRNLYANLSSGEGGAWDGIDFLSNGFRIRTDSNVFNGSNQTCVFMCFAEQPFSAPSNAR